MTIATVIFVYLTGCVFALGRILASNFSDPMQYQPHEQTWLALGSWITFAFGIVVYRDDKEQYFLRFRDPAKLKARRELAEKRGEVRRLKRMGLTRMQATEFVNSESQQRYKAKQPELVPKDYANHPPKPYLWLNRDV